LDWVGLVWVVATGLEMIAGLVAVEIGLETPGAGLETAGAGLETIVVGVLLVLITVVFSKFGFARFGLDCFAGFDDLFDMVCS
jgi:hypothetical protein